MNRKAFFTYLALGLATVSPKSFAQETYTIDSVSVTAARVPIALHQSARIVTLMDSVAIASSPAENVNDLLKYALGVDVRQRGAMGMQTDISMRGGTYNQIAVLLNGINITDPQFRRVLFRSNRAYRPYRSAGRPCGPRLWHIFSGGCNQYRDQAKQRHFCRSQR